MHLLPCARGLLLCAGQRGGLRGQLGKHLPISRAATAREIGILLPNNQRQHRTLHIQEDVLPYALC